MKVIEKSNMALIWITQLNAIIAEKLKRHLLMANELLMGGCSGIVSYCPGESSMHSVRNQAGQLSQEDKRASGRKPK